MTNQEWLRLRAYKQAQQNRPPSSNTYSRRVAKKNVGKAKGQKFLKHGFISHSVHVDTIFKSKI